MLLKGIDLNAGHDDPFQQLTYISQLSHKSIHSSSFDPTKLICDTSQVD